MVDGIYQSLICWFMAYLLFAPATFVTENGLNVNDQRRMGVYVACATVVVVNIYVLINTYRWDWLMLLLVAISILLVWFWTGVYTSFSASYQFYEAASEAYGQLSFWALSLLIVIICLLPRFSAKAFQKIYMPLDIDIIREQVRQGKFNYLDISGANDLSANASSDIARSYPPRTRTQGQAGEEDKRPIYPPSIAQTATTQNAHSQNGSDGTDRTSHRLSLEPNQRVSSDRPRTSFDRIRQSMGEMRPSFEASNDFTSAALLTRLDSSHSLAANRRNPPGLSSLR